MRNKLRPVEYKYKYEIIGLVDSIYEYFTLHDFICIKESEKDGNIDNLESNIL